MPLPTGDILWPPLEEAPRYARAKVNAAWYGGDPDELDSYNGISGNRAEELVRTHTIVSRIAEKFWGAPSTGEAGDDLTKLHVDVPQDIAKLSAEMLFADTVQVKVLGPVYDEDDVYVAPVEVAPEPTPGLEDPTPTVPVAGLDIPINPTVPAVPAEPVAATPPDDWEPAYLKGDPKPETLATQAYVEKMLDRSNWDSLLQSAAETSAAIGGVALKVDWDVDLDDETPFFAKIEADALVPEFRSGKLVSLTFWSFLEKTPGKVVRWLERYERGVVYHGVFEGTDDRLGHAVPVTEYEATKHLAKILNEDGAVIPVEVGSKYQTAVYVPNMLPDPLDRNSNTGRSDYTPAMLGLFDAIDRIYSSLMRDIINGQGRLVVPEYMLEDNGAGKGMSFNKDRAIYSTLNMQPPEEGAESSALTLVQFQIRTEQHIAAAEHLIARAVMSAGYNMRTMGSAADGVAITATQTLAEDRRSLSTRDKKARYWTTSLEQIVEAALAVAVAQFAPDQVQVFPIEVRFREAVQPDALVLGQTAQAFKNAEAASLRVRVETIHPDWDESRISAEVAAIQEESSVVDPNTFGLGGTDNNGAPIDPSTLVNPENPQDANDAANLPDPTAGPVA